MARARRLATTIANDLDAWLRCQSQRLEQQHRSLASCEFTYHEPLVALHGAMLRQMHPTAYPEQLDVIVQAVQRAQRLGELEAARALIRQAAETCSTLAAASSAASDGGTQASGGGAGGYCAATWACRWEEAKLLWSAGGEHCGDALLIAKRLRDELNLATSQSGGSAAGARSQAMRSGNGEAANLHWELLRELGGWMDTLQCEGRTRIEDDLLSRAVTLAEASGDAAVADALFSLARFHGGSSPRSPGSPSRRPLRSFSRSRSARRTSCDASTLSSITGCNRRASTAPTARSASRPGGAS